MAEPRIVLLDIETIPNLQEALENWVDLVPPFPGKKPTMSASVSSICSFGYMVLGQKPVGVNAWDFPKSWARDVNDDREVCAEAERVINSADAIITFNGKNFDKKFIQTRLAIHKMKLLRNIPHIDLCTIVRSNFFLLNGRLKTVAKYLLKDKKLEHDGWPLWVKVHGGVKRVRCKAAEKKMGDYNLKDVTLMEPLFKQMRPLIKNIPNHNLFSPMRVNSCPSCGSTRLHSEGMRHTKTRSYRRYICVDCRSMCHTDSKDEAPRS